MERQATSGYHLLNRLPVRSVQIPSGKCRLPFVFATEKANSVSRYHYWR